MHKLRTFLFANKSTRQTIIKNTFWVGASTTLIKVARAFTIIYAAKLLGTESYGIFTYAMGLAAIFAVVSDIGISTILVRELSKNTERVREYFSTGFVMKLGLLGIMIALILGVAPFISRFSTATVLMPVIALSIALDSLRGFLYSIPRSQNRMQHEAVISIITEACCIALILVIFLKNPSASALAYALMIGNAIGLLIACISVRNYLRGAHRFFVGNLIKPLLRLTAPFAILSIFGIFMTNIDSVVLGMFGNEHMLGIYGAAQRPLNILNIIPGFLSLSLLPMLSKFIQEGKKETVTALADTAARATFAVAVPIVLGGTIVATPLVHVLFGVAYVDAVPVLQILLLTTLFVFPGTIYADVLLAHDKRRIFIFTGILGALLNIVLDIALIPQYGALGSAMATLIAQIAVNVAFYIEAKKQYPLRLFYTLYIPIAAALVMAVLTYALTIIGWPLSVVILLSAVLYVTLLVLWKDRTVTELLSSFR